MSGRRLILMDGTTIENAEAGAADGRLWCYLPQAALDKAFALFSDGERTAKITCVYGEMQEEYQGYTELVCVRRDPYTGEVALQLMRKREGGDAA